MTKPLVSIVIPIAPYHTDIAQNAMDSAYQQTIPCQVVYYRTSGTPAHVRNFPLSNNAFAGDFGRFLVFLDADDTLEPTFVEDCLRAYETGKYVYTSWFEGDTLVHAPSCAPAPDKHHLVTTLYPTEVFRALGGFDESLPGYEDMDFYLKSMAHGICGKLLDKPLLHYTEHGRRSIEFDRNPDAMAIRKLVYERNGGDATVAGCCGGEGQPAVLNPGDQQPGDVLAVIMWNGNSNETSHFNNTRRYKGAGGQRIWVYPYDLENMRMLNGVPMFRKVIDAKTLAPERDEVLKLAGLT